MNSETGAATAKERPMTEEQIEAMRADMAQGTAGPWTKSAVHRPPIGFGPHETDSNGNVFWGYSICGSNEHGGHIYPTLAAVHNFPESIHANARRIARVPDLEAAYLAGLDESTCLRAENERLREYYEANEAIYEVGLIASKRRMHTRLEAARAALKGGA